MRDEASNAAVVWRWAGRLTLILACSATIVTVGWAWRRDRMRVWEEPRFEAHEFVRLSGSEESGRERERWLVAVNPRCPHCRGHLARAVAAGRRSGDVRLDVLLVDTPKPPAAHRFESVAVDGLWWDARDTWRRRWGHRLYGEVVVFDRAGRYVRTMPPGIEGAPPAGR